MKRHHLKIWPGFIDAIWDDLKRYEVRRDDRNYGVGDWLIMREWDPDTELWGADMLSAVVTHKTSGGHLGIPAGHCVLGVRAVMRTTLSELPTKTWSKHDE